MKNEFIGGEVEGGMNPRSKSAGEGRGGECGRVWGSEDRRLVMALELPTGGEETAVNH